ncbi:MAG: UDP-N-acetylglucosamine pyrophosphorylase [Candidatus Zixiibacteriota bacterium]|nr:MAG: UDP-N-acetylglucosamine pyrophosphorylase [candidate division Zixibacteria bacterium]
MESPLTAGLATIIMAAGKGTRMKSDLAKVLHPLNGRPMIHYVIDTARALEADPVVVIVGHQKERVMDELRGLSVRFAVQEPQLGTGHAVQCALPELADLTGAVLVLSGDVPMIQPQTLRRLVNHHFSSGAAATVMTARTDHPRGYGRILRQTSGHLEAIVEERDATEEIRRITEINSGIYVFHIQDLRQVLPRLTTDNEQKEFYLTDAARLLAGEGRVVAAWEGDFGEIMGINTVEELEAAGRRLKTREPRLGGEV